MSVLAAFLFLVTGVIGVVLWVIGAMASKVIDHEFGWWAPRVEDGITRAAAMLLPRRYRNALRQAWLGELAADRASGETRVLHALSFFRAAVGVRWARRRLRDLSHELNASMLLVYFLFIAVVMSLQRTRAKGDSGGPTGEGVVQLDAKIEVVGELSAEVTRANFHSPVMERLLTGTGGGQGGGIGRLGAHGVARASGTAGLGPGGPPARG